MKNSSTKHGRRKITTSSLTENMRMLIDRKVDMTLDDERVLRYAINIGVSRKNTGHAMLVARFNKAIAEMKEDVTHGRIVQ